MTNYLIIELFMCCMNKTRRTFGNWIVLKRWKGTRGCCSVIGTNACDMAEDSLKQEKKVLFVASLIRASLSLSTSNKCVCLCVCKCVCMLDRHTTVPCCCVCDVISWAASVVWWNNLLLLVIFSFFPQQVGNKPTFSLSIFSTSSCKMKPEIVSPPSSLTLQVVALDKLCSL